MTTIRKALAATAFSFVAALGAALLDGHLDQGEALAAVGIALVAGGGTYAAPPNAPQRRPRRRA